jgi:hypothetical protein
MINEYTLANFIDDELEDGRTFEEILELFDLSPGEVFNHLFESGMIDETLLETYLLDVE